MNDFTNNKKYYHYYLNDFDKLNLVFIYLLIIIIIIINLKFNFQISHQKYNRKIKSDQMFMTSKINMIDI